MRTIYSQIIDSKQSLIRIFQQFAKWRRTQHDSQDRKSVV